MRILKIISLVLFTVRLQATEIKIVPGSGPARSAISKVISPGTPIGIAQNIMEKNGFTCQIIHQGDFSVNDHTRGNIAVLHKENYIYCDLTHSGIPFLQAAKRWQVALVFRENLVTEIFVSYGLVGL